MHHGLALAFAYALVRWARRYPLFPLVGLDLAWGLPLCPRRPAQSEPTGVHCTVSSAAGPVGHADTPPAGGPTAGCSTAGATGRPHGWLPHQPLPHDMAWLGLTAIRGARMTTACTHIAKVGVVAIAAVVDTVLFPLMLLLLPAMLKFVCTYC